MKTVLGRWIEKFHNLTKEERDIIIEKTINKYKSDKYINKEYLLGYEPREELYKIFFNYALKYGEKIPDKYYPLFVKEAYTFDEWNVFLFVGQGHYISIEKKKNN